MGVCRDIQGPRVVRETIKGASAIPQELRPLRVERLHKLFNDEIPKLLDSTSTLGAALSIVKDGRQLLEGGYGYADLTRSRPFMPTTPVRGGSISKAITWSAILQLVDRQVLSLTSDIQEYLDFVVPRRFPGAITLQHLITHSAGFESNTYGFSASWSLDEAVPLGEAVRRNIPVQVRAPGTANVYCNWGAAAAGRVIELSTGLSFEQYVQRNIFVPLAMQGSTFEEGTKPMDEAVGFVFDGTHHYQHPSEYYSSVGPAASLTTSASDLSKFLCAQLRTASSAEVQIWSAASLQRMRQRDASSLEILDGVTLGYYETTRHGRRFIGHGGATVSFESRLMIDPGNGIGIVITSNTGGTGFCEMALELIVGSIYESKLPKISPSKDFASKARGYGGKYAPCARSSSRTEKLFSYEWAISVRAESEHLTIAGLGDCETHWTEVIGHQGLFRRSDGEDLIMFTPSSEGYLLLGANPLSPLVRMGPLEATFNHKVLRNAGLLFMALGALLSGDLNVGACAACALGLAYLLIAVGVDKALKSDLYSLLAGPPGALVIAKLAANVSLPIAASFQALVFSEGLAGVPHMGTAAVILAGMYSAVTSYWLYDMRLLSWAPWTYM